MRPSARLLAHHCRQLGPLVAPSCISSQSSWPMGIVGNRGAVGGPRGAAGGQPWAGLGGSGLLWRVKNQAFTHTRSDNRGSSRPTPGPTTCQTLSTPCVPALYTGTQPAKPLGITGCPAGQWTNTWPPGQSRGPAGPPGGVSGPPRRVCVTHSHFWAKIVTTVHHRQPHSTYDAHLVNRGE